MPCSKEEYGKIYNLDYSWFVLVGWRNETELTGQEKKDHPHYKTTGGYCKTNTYKEAWSKCPKEFIEQVKKLKNFDAKVFEEITGLKI